MRRYYKGWLRLGRVWIGIHKKRIQIIPVIAGGTSALTQMEDTWAFGDDDGSESAHSLDTENTNRSSQAADENFLIRMQARETNGKNDPWAMFLYCSYNDGAWQEVSTTASSGLPVKLTNDTQSRADDENTTERLSAPGAGTFTAGKFDDGTGAVGCSNVALNGQYSDFEFCVQIDSAYASNGDTFEFRLEGSGGTDLDNYVGDPNYPTATASGITAPSAKNTDPFGLGIGVGISRRVKTFLGGL